MSLNKNAWHDKLYDSFSAQKTLNSAEFKVMAAKGTRAIIKLLKLNPEARVLDVPCGTGRYTVEFARRGFDVTGVDINPELL